MSLPGCFDMTSFSAGIWFHGWRQLTSATPDRHSSSLRLFQGLTRVKEWALWFGKHSRFRFNDTKLQKWKRNKKSCNNSVYCAPSPHGSTLGSLTVTNSYQGCCSTGGLPPEWLLTSSLPWNPEPKPPARVATSWFAAMKSALFYSYQPTQSVTNGGSVMRYKASSGSSCSLWEAVQK